MRKFFRIVLYTKCTIFSSGGVGLVSWGKFPLLGDLMSTLFCSISLQASMKRSAYIYWTSQFSNTRLFQLSVPSIPPSAAAGSIDHLRIALQLSSLSQPASYISIPVQAIIAALSVHSEGGGNANFTFLEPLRSRKERRLE